MNDITLIPTQIIDELQRSDTINAVMDTTINYIRSIAKPQTIDEEWVKGTSDLMSFFHSVNISGIHVVGMLLAIYEDNWLSIPPELRKDLGPTVMEWGTQFTDGKYSTMRNYIRVAREWFLNPDNFIPQRVEILQRDEKGKPIRNPDGSYATRTIEFKPHEINYSKLLVATTALTNDRITPELWGMLADPHFVKEDIVLELSESDPDSPAQTRYYAEGPAIIATRNGKERQILEFNWDEYETDDLVRECIDRLLSFLHIELDEDAILRLTRRANGKVVVNGEVKNTKKSW